ncbi:hypothetical protein [Kitasatospora sp. GP30]|uniref:hypothetical protein n=1 Tax=Kitasatospora sp. GP30 TaxID=3035084 RepID=UPI002475C8E1|nr:hypothetical protein [Kitasatospora sp. GP30]
MPTGSFALPGTRRSGPEAMKAAMLWPGSWSGCVRSRVDTYERLTRSLEQQADLQR